MLIKRVGHFAQLETSGFASPSSFRRLANPEKQGDDLYITVHRRITEITTVCRIITKLIN